MNIEATIPTVTTKTADATTSQVTSSAASKEDTKSFKEELSAKAQETTVKKAVPEKGTTEVAATQDIKTLNGLATESVGANTANTQKNVTNNITQQVNKDQLKSKDKTDEKVDKKDIINPLNELTSQIVALSNFKNGSNQTSQNSDTKIDKASNKSDYCQTLKMDNNDITFFINLVDNQQMTAQATQGINKGQVSFTDIKAEATQQSVKVSVPLMDALNDSIKTNKPFRIDFGNDVAVIMKVDKDGNLSANFIPGTAAAETYLKNNIENLRQTFDEQNLPYKNLSYGNQQKQQQQEKRNNKENENE